MIYLKEKGNKKSKFIFPSMPEEITTSVDTSYQSYSLLNRGSVAIPKGIEPKNISWSGEFFGKTKRKEAIVIKNKWTAPKSCKNILEKWQKKKTVLTLIITEAGINIDVTISSFKTVDYGAHGNLKYSISFESSDSLKVYVHTSSKKSGKKKTSNRASTSKKSYTVKSGDNLWKISRRMYGAGAKWQKIYKANKNTIESAARKHGRSNSSNGWWIYPGTKLIIPT